MRTIWFLLALASVSAPAARATGAAATAATAAAAATGAAAWQCRGRRAAGAFAGQWTCPYTTNSGFQDSTKFVFTANPDGTLSSTSTIQSDPCTLSWTVSGSTATAMSNQTCGGFTVTSYTFKLEDGIAFAEATAVEHGTTTGADGGPAPVDIAGGFAGFCTRDGAGDAGTPTVCEQDSLVGCGANGVGYLCVGTTSPESLNSALSCPQLFTDGSSCCTLGAAASTCHSDSSVACTAGRSGYRCSGTDTPAQAASIVCEPGKANGSDTTYCCETYASPSCSLSGGCSDYAFSCSGSAQPWESDPTLRCDQGTPDLNGATIFCCSVRDPSAPDTCVRWTTTDNCAPTTGYSCTGSDAPSDDDPSLVCGMPTAFQGESIYCCRSTEVGDAGED